MPASTALSHIKVLDLTRVRAGPTAVRQLADWGAQVIKIEMPPGLDEGEGPGGPREGSDFQNVHRNKRGMTLNLKSPEGVAILKKLASKQLFPNMQAIVVAGHSAGGQFVARYQAANKVHETLGVPVSYVVANPSSYAWPDAMRVLPVDDAVAASAKDGWNQTAPHTKFSYAPFEGAASCAGYNTWPFGLEKRTGGYTAKTSDDQLRKQLVSRPTTFLLGQVDTLPLGGFDSSCGAMAQGPTRRARGEAYVKYISEKFGAKHPIMIVDECGHNNRCVFTTDNVLPVIFPK